MFLRVGDTPGSEARIDVLFANDANTARSTIQDRRRRRERVKNGKERPVR